MSDKPYLTVENPTYKLIRASIILEAIDPATIPGDGGYPAPTNAIRRAVERALEPYGFLRPTGDVVMQAVSTLIPEELCSACTAVIEGGYRSPNDDPANGLRFCRDCTERWCPDCGRDMIDGGAPPCEFEPPFENERFSEE